MLAKQVSVAVAFLLTATFVGSRYGMSVLPRQALNKNAQELEGESVLALLSCTGFDARLRRVAQHRQWQPLQRGAARDRRR